MFTILEDGRKTDVDAKIENGRILLSPADFERALAQSELTVFRSRIEAAAALADLLAGTAGAESDLVPPPGAEATP